MWSVLHTRYAWQSEAHFHFQNVTSAVDSDNDPTTITPGNQSKWYVACESALENDTRMDCVRKGLREGR